MNQRGGRNLKKAGKRLLWFLLFAFCFCLPECYLLIIYAHLSPVVNGIIIVSTACVFYLVFLVICAKIDKKKEKERREKSSKDPFTH